MNLFSSLLVFYSIIMNKQNILKTFPEKIKKQSQLAFPKVESIDDDDNDDEYISKGPSQKLMNYFSTSIDELTEWFRNYQVESIEVWISKIVEKVM